MSDWKRVKGDPITVESEVRVYNVDNPDQEGYVTVQRTREGIHLGRTVYDQMGPEGRPIAKEIEIG